jgi:hypothetical protein
MKRMKTIVFILLIFVICLGMINAKDNIIYKEDSLSALTVYPVPYKKDIMSSHGIYFRNLTRTARIYVFSIAGECVFDCLTDDGVYEWDTKNNDGETVVSGIYIYVVINEENSKDFKHGKMMIIG